MKFKLLLIFAVLSFCMSKAYSQGGIFLSQYYQNLPGFNPALTGATDFLDIRVGTRQQWVGFDGAPQTYFVAANGIVKPKVNPYRKNSLRVSEATEAVVSTTQFSNAKWGFGGSILQEEQGPFKQMEATFNVASHIAIADRTYLSMGLASGFSNYQINIAEIIVADMANDATYAQFLANGFDNTYANLNAGVSVYSDKYYVGLSSVHLSRTLLAGNEMLNSEATQRLFHAVGGYRLYLQKFDIVPNFNIRMQISQPLLIDLGARVRYNKLISAGAAYRNDHSIVGLVGLDITDKITFTYSIESKVGNKSDIYNGSHEVLLGLKLFNHNRYNPLW